MIALRKYICAIVCVRDEPVTFFNGTWLYLRKIYKVCLFTLMYLADIFLKNEWSKPVTSRKTIANDNIRTFKWKSELWKSWLCHNELDGSPIDCFWWDWWWYEVNVILWYYIMKHINIWKSCITQWTNVF